MRRSLPRLSKSQFFFLWREPPLLLLRLMTVIGRSEGDDTCHCPPRAPACPWSTPDGYDKKEQPADAIPVSVATPARCGRFFGRSRRESFDGPDINDRSYHIWARFRGRLRSTRLDFG